MRVERSAIAPNQRGLTHSCSGLPGSHMITTCSESDAHPRTAWPAILRATSGLTAPPRTSSLGLCMVRSEDITEHRESRAEIVSLTVGGIVRVERSV